MWPLVIMPDATKLLVDLIADHPSLPLDLADKVVAELPDSFPASLPWCEIRQVPGAGSRPVPIRVAQASLDIHVYAFRNDEAASLARIVAAITQSLVGAKTNDGGVSFIEVTEPFPLPDVTTAHRWIVQVLISYRPL